MKKLIASALVCGMLLGCAPQRFEMVTPADSVQAKPKQDWFSALALSALIVLVLFPILMPKK